MTTAHFSPPLSHKHALRTVAIAAILCTSLMQVHAPSRVAAQEEVQPAASPISSTTAPAQLFLTAIPTRLGDDGSLSAAPGQTIQTSIKIRNASTQDQLIETIAEDFIVGDDGEQPIPVGEETSSRWSLSSWMTLSPSRQMVRANETATLNVLIEVPADAYPGGRYAMIMHQPTGEDSSLGASSGVAQRVGTLLYFQVEGPINEEAYISPINAPQLSEVGPVPLSFSLDNRSDIHIRPSMTATITNMFGKEIDDIRIDTKNVFPYTARDFSTTWERVWGFGRYTATITATYGSSGQTVSQSTHFWIIPVKILLAIGIGLSSLLVIALLIRRHLLHRGDLQTQRIQMLEEKLRSIESDQEKKFSDDQF